MWKAVLRPIWDSNWSCFRFPVLIIFSISSWCTLFTLFFPLTTSVAFRTFCRTFISWFLLLDFRCFLGVGGFLKDSLSCISLALRFKILALRLTLLSDTLTVCLLEGFFGRFSASIGGTFSLFCGTSNIFFWTGNLVVGLSGITTSNVLLCKSLTYSGTSVASSATEPLRDGGCPRISESSLRTIIWSSLLISSIRHLKARRKIS